MEILIVVEHCVLEVDSILKHIQSLIYSLDLLLVFLILGTLFRDVGFFFPDLESQFIGIKHKINNLEYFSELLPLTVVQQRTLEDVLFEFQHLVGFLDLILFEVNRLHLAQSHLKISALIIDKHFLLEVLPVIVGCLHLIDDHEEPLP